MKYLTVVLLLILSTEPAQCQSPESKLLRTFAGHTDAVSSVAFSPDDKRIASGSFDKTTKIWETNTGELLRTLEGHTDRVLGVAFSPDGKQIVSASSDKTLKLWETNTGELLKTLEGHEFAVTNVAFHPVGKRVVSGSGLNGGRASKIKVWDVQTGQELRTIMGNIAGLNPFSLSPQGTHLVSANSSRTLNIHEVSTGKPLKMINRRYSTLLCLSYSPDGKRIVTGGIRIRGIRLNPAMKQADVIGINIWDADTGELLKTLAETKLVHSVAFSPDGKRIVSGQDQGCKSGMSTAENFQTRSTKILFAPVLSSARMENSLRVGIGRKQSNFGMSVNEQIASDCLPMRRLAIRSGSPAMTDANR
jgi:WD40 repeat protein